MKKLVIILLLSFFALFLPVKTFAQTLTPAAQKPLTQYPLNTNPDVPQNLHTYTQNVFIDMLSTASCFLTGTDPISQSNKCLGIDTKTGKLGYTNQNSGGLLLTMGNLIGKTYDIPISTAGYTHYLARNFGISRSSYAERIDGGDGGGSGVKSGFGQGIGFIGLTPVLKIWVVLRNLSYLVFVFIFILLGLGIMFRVNIDARTVMSIQNQIPKIVIGLVLITLSYAIAGFLIDMMYVATYLIIHVFNSQGLATVTNISGNPITAVGFMSGGFNDIAGPPASSVGGIVASLFDGNIGTVLSTIVTTVIGAMIGGGTSIPFGGLVGGILGAVTGFLFGATIIKLISTVIVYLIIVIAVFNALFRVWFMLIKAYIFILLDVIFAPFWIMIGILPFGSGGFGPWIRSLIANLAAFPVVLTLFMIGKSIQENVKPNAGNFMPPLVGNLGNDSTAAVGSIIGLGLILIMPEAVNITKSVLKAPEMKLATAAGRAIGVGQAAIGKPIGGLKGEYFGKDAFGAPREGSRMVAKRFGKIGQLFSGGGIKNMKDENNKDVKTPWVKFPHPLGKKMDSGGREKNWLGKLTPEGKELHNAQKTTKETLGKGEFDAAKHEKYTLHGQEHVRNKSADTDGNDGNGGEAASGGNPAQPPGPPPQSDPNAGAHEQSAEGAAEESTESTGTAPTGETAQEVSQAAESGAFRGARRGVAGENIEDSTKNSIEEGLKREREEEERKRNGGETSGGIPI